MTAPARQVRDGARLRTGAGRRATAGALREGAAAVTGYLPAVVFLLMLVAAWQVFVDVVHVSDFVLPAPLVILKTTLHYFPLMLRQTWTTTYEIGLGLSSATRSRS